MNFRIPRKAFKALGAVVFVTVFAGAGFTWNRWYPSASVWVSKSIASFRGGDTQEESEDAGHEAHVGEAAAAIELSQQALRNIGLTSEYIQPVELQTFRKSMTVPALVAERPGRTHVEVATPMTGVITHVHAIQGESVAPGTLLFQIRLTHEDLVKVQTEFLRTLGELDVEKKEIDRLTAPTRSGAIAGSLLLEREYARDRLTALLSAQREALRLHGLSADQVGSIETGRRLLRELQVFAPTIDDHSADEFKLTDASAGIVSPKRSDTARPTGLSAPTDPTPLVLRELLVHKGQSVEAGETLCVLADYGELYIEGLAFEQDIEQLRQATQRGWNVDAIFDLPDSRTLTVENLEIDYLSNDIDPQTRALRFYVKLPNQLMPRYGSAEGKFIEWKYLPGQRLQLRIPVDEWNRQIVLPVDAVAREAAESYVFRQNGKEFERVPIHIKYRDQYSAVIENDGSLFPGDVVALRGAHQIQMAVKNKSGGAVDPHAGHTH